MEELGLTEENEGNDSCLLADENFDPVIDDQQALKEKKTKETKNMASLIIFYLSISFLTQKFLIKLTESCEFHKTE